MKITNVYDKDYKCSKCDKTVQYGQVTDDGGKVITKDRKPFNKKFGKQSNLLSAAVDKGTVNLHACYASYVIKDFDELTGVIKPEPVVEKMSPAHSTEVDIFLSQWDDAWNAIYIKACKMCGEGAMAKDKQICACGMMHDYFSFRQTLK